MSAAAFWIGFGIGGSLAIGFLVGTWFDCRGSFAGPPMAIGIRKATETALWVVLSPVVGGAVGFLVGAAIDGVARLIGGAA